MTDDQISACADRFVTAFEKIASSLEGLNETYRRHYERLYPEKKQVREAVVTRVPTEEDRIRAAQGSSDQSLGRWLDDLDQEEEEVESIGVRERQWLEGHRRSAQPAPDAGS